MSYFGTDKKYNVIYADPPWHFSHDAYQSDGREFLDLSKTQYKTMTIDEIKSMPVNELSSDDCACFLWVVDTFLKEGIEVLESWGFTYKTIAFNWLKTYEGGKYCVNFAPWTLKSWEICLLGVKGSMRDYKKSNNVQGLVIANRTVHSKKPDIIRERIVNLFGDIPKIELFARQEVFGWDAWGNEVNKFNSEKIVRTKQKRLF